VYLAPLLPARVVSATTCPPLLPVKPRFGKPLPGRALTPFLDARIPISPFTQPSFDFSAENFRSGGPDSSQVDPLEGG